MTDHQAWKGYIKNMVPKNNAFYETARLNARQFLLEPNIEPKKVCLLAGHDLDEDQEIAVCAICDQQGCTHCLDSHECSDYERVV
jgi:hypothetical protein